MTDEAFIRAIVDSPGDDLPRLAYADWLDERDDPRGAYLRTECEWAKPWRDGERPANEPKLRSLAAGLDPLWVARVSRPPAGVCCDHIDWEKRGRSAHEAEIRFLEENIGATLPPDYRAFILNQNGAELGQMDHDCCGWRFGTLNDIQDSYYSWQKEFGDRESSSDASNWLCRLLWIGQGYEIIDQLMLGLFGQERGMICVIDSNVPLETNYEWYRSGYKPHSKTFGELLSSLPGGL